MSVHSVGGPAKLRKAASSGSLSRNQSSSALQERRLMLRPGSVAEQARLEMVPGTSIPRYHWTTERSNSLGDILAKMKKSKNDPAAHLRQSCLQMGVRTNWETTTRNQQWVPASKAQEPRWSSELRAIDNEIIDKIHQENRLSGSLPISPEMAFLRKSF
eukprot:TRINITY_DN36951_c0_g1_i1.p1 TRINITY_DN36951_c0_g1~~TRINITY_DN36951_c0_g1_i1.p1  ORF type:complete len:159 (-),score=24.19 TRINITY_DN36951_c0_g1_i1:68-544(-)